jgi:hypothetical protein
MVKRSSEEPETVMETRILAVGGRLRAEGWVTAASASASVTAESNPPYQKFQFIWFYEEGAADRCSTGFRAKLD